jgi:hypothetical protein
MERYQFDFVKFFQELNLDSYMSRPAHFFAMGKELMLLQLNRDNFLNKNIVSDRGFLTVLAWGLSEKRITEQEANSQLKMMFDNGLLDEVVVIYVKGKGPNRGTKDIWDHTEESNTEEKYYNFLIEEIRLNYPSVKILDFENGFNKESIWEINSIVEENVRNNNN